MRSIATMQFKGGVGKSTILMALASAAVSRGEQVVVIDTDQNLPFTKWEKAGKQKGFWSDLIAVESYLKFEDLFDAAVTHEKSGNVDLLLIDPRGGRSQFINGVAQLVDVLLIPTRPNKVDADALLDTFELLKELKSSTEHVGVAKMVFSAIKPVNQLSAAMKSYKSALESTAPKLDTEMRERVAYQNMQALGLLGQIAHDLTKSSNPLSRGQSKSYASALGEALSLLKECDKLSNHHHIAA